LTVLDTFLVVLSFTPNGFINVYSTNDYSLIGEFSGKGRGPGEFITPTVINHVDGVSDNILHVYDASNMKVTRVDLERSTGRMEYSYEQERMDFLGEPTTIDWIYHIGDDFIGYKGDGPRFSLFNTKTKKKSYISYGYPEPTFPFEEGRLRFLFNSECVINSKLEKVALAPLYVGQLELFNLDGKHIKTTVFCDYNELKDSMQELVHLNNTDLKIFTQDIVSNEDYIFLLNVNATLREVETSTSQPKSEVLVFDWNGSPVEKFILDRTAARIAIDFEHSILYALCPLEEEYPLVKYPFN
jgi:hypothetical protein